MATSATTTSAGGVPVSGAGRTGPDAAGTPAHDIDAEFLALPRAALADAALQTARDLGATHADIRIERIRDASLSFRDGGLESRGDGQSVGFAVRVVHNGTWGFAAGVDLTVDEAVRVTREAVEIARVAHPLNSEPVELADEPVHADARWVSAYAIDPFAVETAEKIERVGGLCRTLLAAEDVDHVNGRLGQVLENKFYADLAGTTTTQQRVRVICQIEATRVERAAGGFETMRTIAPPVGRGWEWLVAGPAAGCWDWDAEIELIPSLLAEKAKASSVEPGRYDLVIDPSNLWLTIHESVGHATELDRALGYEAAYAGTSFATLDKIGKLRYGSPAMHVTGDRTAPHGLATIGYDDEGVQAGQWDIVRAGTLVGYQLDRRMAAQNTTALGTGRSNGCAFADSSGHVPIQRMANVSLQPAPGGPSTEELISRVDRGIYIVGDKSWSIDMQRYNFQFTGQRFYEIRDGRIVGQLRDVAYQATTTDFWGSLEAVGGEATYVLGGAFNCGKGQPGQVAAVSHGCPSALFRDVNILNTQREAGR
ncbi:TldD/PmbA family protein [Protofrankia symbiont of Coriaria ruscifolia]|uniref:Peptidase U62 modulator of DNA gyrase n=1 Tax=Candidatus Protofrankia californiensis TaxID=1839754 RepID=A0A1C3NUM7_9ACTN|nr:TldD/PmbA family protein [Protofrankia symbiont of Coriaria ruscifolia]SBW19172.1 peptidase U62 modulator of DNA gyrase [Candidatus Protofrankia californiensis]